MKKLKQTKKSKLRQFIVKYKVAVVVLAFSLIGATIIGISSAATPKTQLQYFISPHPDDIYAAWGMVQHSPANYPVFVVLTAGEETSLCTGQTITVTGYGSFAGARKGSASCKGARLSSLNAWLDDQAQRDSTLDNLKNTATKQYCFSPQSSTIPFNANDNAQHTCATYIIGPKSARVEFDLGDGNLTVPEVNWAIRNIRASRGVFPVTKEYGVVADAYYNGNYPGCGVYTHPDHYAVQSAIFHTDQFANDPAGYHPQFGATCASDPDYRIDNYSKTIDASDYAANMNCPSGYFQKRYGWLVFGTSKNGCWSSGTQKQMQARADAVFPSDEYFWVRKHPKS